MFLLPVAEPTFVSMTEMPESEMSAEGDDDKVYLFFSETAVECDCYNKLVVSRVARVCKVKGFTVHSTVALMQPFPLLDCASRLFVFFHSSVWHYVSVCAHRGILEVRGPCRRNGHPS